MLTLQFWRSRRVPLILQTEASECGSACVAMISSYHGHRIDLASMRRRFSVSLKGATLKSLMDMAQGLGLQTRPLKLGIEQLNDLRLPCILHWDLTHFVVLTSIVRNGVYIHDPASGTRRISFSDLSRHFTGIALEMSPGTLFTKKVETQKFTLFSLMGKIVGLKRGLGQILLLGVALQVCTLVAPFYMQWIVDEAVLAGDRDLVTVLGCGFLLLVGMQTAITAVRAWATTALAADLNFQWLGNAFLHLMKLPLPFFEKRHLGDIVSRFGSIQTIQRNLTTQFVDGIIDGMLVIATLGVMLLYSAQLTLVSVLAVFLYSLMRLSVFRSLQEASAEQIIHSAKQQTHFYESVSGIQSVRLFGRADARRSGWMNTLADQFNADLRISKMSISYQTASTFLFGAERVIIIWLAALSVLDTRFSVGMLFAFISYKDHFTQRFAALVDKFFELRMLRLHGERIADILLAEVETNNEESEICPDQIPPTIKIINLSFRYADGEPFVLRRLNLSIGANEFVAITGASGSGKTTLAKLILGLLEPTEGEIHIGGRNLKSIGLANYRNLVGTVMQNDHVFSGSLAENINFFDPSPDQNRVEQCAMSAAIHDEIMSMPMAYNTIVGSISSGLSGGQIQRILLARALYKRPRILILDEATSHLDIRNEFLVNKAIEKTPLTRIVIAHRPETIATAQRVVVLQEGKIFDEIVNHAA